MMTEQPDNVTPIKGWAKPTAAPEYDPNQFYVRATNTYNHSTTLRLAIPPELMSQIQEIVMNIPQLKNGQDFVRDAVYHRIHYLAENGYTSPQIERWQRAERVQVMLEATANEKEQMRDLIASAKEQLRDLREAGDGEMLVVVLHELEDTVEVIREPWASKLAKVLEDYR